MYNLDGACGFGQYGRVVNNGYVSAVSRALYKDGAGCGACYKVLETIEQYCTYKFTRVLDL